MTCSSMEVWELLKGCDSYFKVNIFQILKVALPFIKQSARGKCLKSIITMTNNSNTKYFFFCFYITTHNVFCKHVFFSFYITIL